MEIRKLKKLKIIRLRNRQINGEIYSNGSKIPQKDRIQLHKISIKFLLIT